MTPEDGLQELMSQQAEQLQALLSEIDTSQALEKLLAEIGQQIAESQEALAEMSQEISERLQALLAEISTTGPALLQTDEQELSVLLSSLEPGYLIEAAQAEDTS